MITSYYRAKLRRHFRKTEGLPFAKLLPVEQIQETMEDYRFRDRIFSPFVTIWCFLHQVLNQDSSCRAVVARVLAHRVSHGLKPCSPRTGGFVQARQRLSENTVKNLARDVGCEVQRRGLQKWLWKGRHVKIVDGTGLTIADTPENRNRKNNSLSHGEGCCSIFTYLRYGAGVRRRKMERRRDRRTLATSVFSSPRE